MMAPSAWLSFWVHPARERHLWSKQPRRLLQPSWPTLIRYALWRRLALIALERMILHVPRGRQDKDGRLGPDELQGLLKMSQGVELSKLDLDADGYVTHDELLSSVEQDGYAA